jgi:adenosylmethionine-8-amino-7-oxononanoate aminotransferase
MRNQKTQSYINVQLAKWGDMPIKHLRHQGMIWAFDVITSSSKFQQDFYQQSLSQGLLLRPIGNTVYFMPPYVISESEIDFMLSTTQSLVRACA